MRALVLLTFFALACGDGPDTQYVPIGSRCNNDITCGTSPFSCAPQDKYPGGYCQRACGDGMCPADSICVEGQCRRRCTGDEGCRRDGLAGTEMDYACVATGSDPNVKYCESKRALTQ
jgi:hypothetical protein